MTQQIRDRLIYENQEYSLNVELLEQYFREYPEKRPELDAHSTALWRGYVAVFEIKNNKLLIKELDWLADINFKMNSLKNEIFPDNKFEWFSGLIRIDNYRGEFDQEPEDGIFEYLQIEAGNFIKKLVLNYEELQAFKKEQYAYFLLSDEVQLVYDFWRKGNEHGTTNIENVNAIILAHIMEYTRIVYV